MAGMTHVQYRNKLVGNVRSSYRELMTAKSKVEKYTEAKNEKKRIEWEGRVSSAARDLEAAFKELPEVKAGPVDMDAMTFSKTLTEDDDA